VGSVLKSLVKTIGIIGIIAGLVLPGTVYAVGMGGINVTSALGQPLSAEIDLVSVNQSDKSSLSAHLASPDEFKGAGIDYPYSLPKLKFKIETRPDGTSYLKLTTQDPVNDPFVSLLVELDWASGKLLREYTFLLDPPGYSAVQPKAEAVQPVEPTVAAPQPQAQPMTEAAPQTKAMPMRATSPMNEKAFTAPKQLGKPAAAGNVASGPITVKRGDTLTKIATQIKEPDVTLEQMLVALYRANANQFDGKNMNRLRAGKILRRPAESDFANLSNKEAVKVIHAQAADWHAYRQKLAAASSAASGQAPQQEVSGKISTSVSDKTPAAKESAKEVLRLSKGEAPGDKVAAGGNVRAMQDRIHSLEEEAVARNKELQDSKDRIALLEKNIKEMQYLIDLKAQPVPAAKPAEAKPATKPEPGKIVPPPAAGAASGVAAASAVQAAKPAAQPKPVVKHKPRAVPKVVPPPPSLLDEIMGNPLYLAGGAAVLLALGGLSFVATRRSGKGGKKDIRSALAGQQVGEVTGSHMAEPVAPSPETGDFTHARNAETTAGEVSEPSEEVDPISEAELFLNFGRYAQAEEVLKEALSKDPNNLRILLKLLGIYANQKDVNAFSSIARRVKDSGDADGWEQAAAMGRKIDPANPMYGGTGVEKAAAGSGAGAAVGKAGEAAVTDLILDEGKSEAPAALDFDLGFGAPEAASATEAEPQEAVEFKKTATLSPEVHAQEMPLDFDITADQDVTPAPGIKQPESKQPKSGEPAKDDIGLDFDITSPNPSMTAVEPKSATADMKAEGKAEAASLDDLIFDVTATQPGTPAVKPEAAGKSKPMDIGLGDISLNLDVGTAGQPAAAGGKNEQWHEVATKLDLAKAYQEMGDAEGAHEILEEVLRDGDDQQCKAAQVLIDQLPA
jgi:pilus assembly protein FimV